MSRASSLSPASARNWSKADDAETLKSFLDRLNFRLPSTISASTSPAAKPARPVAEFPRPDASKQADLQTPSVNTSLNLTDAAENPKAHTPPEVTKRRESFREAVHQLAAQAKGKTVLATDTTTPAANGPTQTTSAASSNKQEHKAPHSLPAHALAFTLRASSLGFSNGGSSPPPPPNPFSDDLADSRDASDASMSKPIPTSSGAGADLDRQQAFEKRTQEALVRQESINQRIAQMHSRRIPGKSESDAARQAQAERDMTSKRTVVLEKQRKAEQAFQAMLKAQNDARQKAEEERRAKAAAETEARQKAQEEMLRRQAEEQARKKAAEQARLKEEAEARRRAEQEKYEREQAEARRTMDEARIKAKEEARKRAEEEARAKAEQEAKRKAEEEVKRKAEQEARRKAEEESRLEAQRKKEERIAAKREEVLHPMAKALDDIKKVRQALDEKVAKDNEKLEHNRAVFMEQLETGNKQLAQIGRNKDACIEQINEATEKLAEQTQLEEVINARVGKANEDLTKLDDVKGKLTEAVEKRRAELDEKERRVMALMDKAKAALTGEAGKSIAAASKAPNGTHSVRAASSKPASTNSTPGPSATTDGTAEKAPTPAASAERENVETEGLLRFKAWPMPANRPHGAAKVRRVQLSNLPSTSTVTTIQALVWGGRVESISYTPGSPTAWVVFMRADDSAKYLDETSNGIEVPGDDRIVWVEPSKEPDAIHDMLRGHYDAGVTRCVRVVGVDEEWGMGGLTKLAAGDGRKVERVINGANQLGRRTVEFRFHNIHDALKFRVMLTKDEEWEQCNIMFGPDPCATATGVHTGM